MNRLVLPELLDVLPPQDSEALRSRRDLRRLNAWMSHPNIMARTLQQHLPSSGPVQLAELGAGDGHFLLTVARRLQGRWHNPEAVLVDRLKALDPAASEQFKHVGWQMLSDTTEAGDWLRQVAPGAAPTIISNLFFHQFQAEQLAEMFRLAAGTARLVVALEPRRSWLPLLVCRLLWVIGCGPVTRHDARLSVQAGFAGRELSSLWPDQENWVLIERPVGLFSHLFVARRKD